MILREWLNHVSYWLKEGILNDNPCPLGMPSLTDNGAVSEDGRLWSRSPGDHKTLEELIVFCGQDFLGVEILLLLFFGDLTVV